MLKGILKKMFVLSAVHDGSDWRFTLIELIRYRKKTRVKRRLSIDDPGSLKKYRKEPFVLVIGGAGVISKIFSAEDISAARISDNPDKFISYTEPAGGDSFKLTFMRRELFDGLIRQLAPYKLSVISTRIDTHGNILIESLEAGDDFFGKGLSLREILHPAPETNQLASVCTNKIMLPVLGGILIILSLNFFIQHNLRQEIQRQQFLLTRLNRELNSDTEQEKQRAKVVTMLLPGSKDNYSLLADRIASVVPAEITLTELTLTPLGKKIQEGKPLQAQTGKVKITGNGSSSNPVAVFADSLKSFGFVKDIKLVSLDKDRTGNYVFEIELYLCA